MVGRLIWSFPVSIFLSSPLPFHHVCCNIILKPQTQIVGQVPYHSNITGITEQLPVTVSIVTRRGCDFVLFDLLEGLAAEGIVQTVKTGRTAF